jgi:hypothetical protein
MPEKPFNGHPSWNQWNVALWINNDEWLYAEAVRLVRAHGYERGARRMAANLAGEHTPDGARYNLMAIRNAIRGILD